MASSCSWPTWRNGRFLGLLLVWGQLGCGTGEGQGELSGSISVAECGEPRDYDMRPNFFGAQPIEDLLEIRVQRGSGAENVVDGIHMLVRDAAGIQERSLGTALAVDNEAGPVGVTLYLNRTCPPRRDRTPVVLPAIGGSVEFSSLYAPEGERDMVEISATLRGLQFADPRNPERTAQLEGGFSFLFQRGSPAQRFP